MDQNRLALLALHFIPGIGNHIIKQLVTHCGAADAVFHANKKHLLQVAGIGETLVNNILQAKPFAQAEREARKAERESAQLLFYTDHDYPQRLLHHHDAPSMLYYRGHADLNAPKTVAIVGTRRATDYGKQCVDDLVAGLVPHGAMIVSGLAYGIDIQAHKQALHHHLSTVGVLGSGLDVIYPAAHRDTARRMIANGGLLTENAFGTKPDAHNFPARNRIIAALADAVVVVEAAESGGALITADIANGYNKDVFAFPGNVGRAYSEGCNALIKQHKASLITSVKDIEYLLNWDTAPRDELSLSFVNLDPDERVIVSALRAHKNQLSIDELCWHSGFTMGKLAGLLLSLELKDVLTPLPGKSYRLTKP